MKAKHPLSIGERVTVLSTVLLMFTDVLLSLSFKLKSVLFAKQSTENRRCNQTGTQTKVLVAVPRMATGEMKARLCAPVYECDAFRVRPLGVFLRCLIKTAHKDKNLINKLIKLMNKSLTGDSDSPFRRHLAPFEPPKRSSRI